MTHACLAWCDFENADFSEVSLSEAILVRVNFSGASMRNINFSYSNIVACNFEGASCQNASFKNMIQDLDQLKREQDSKYKALRGVDLGEMKELSFSHATLTNADFSGAKLKGALFLNSVGQHCIFTKARGEKMLFKNAIFNYSVFNTTKFEKTELNGTVMRNTVCSDSQFINCSFNGVDFSDSVFTGLHDKCFLGGCMVDVKFCHAQGLSSKYFSNICLKWVDFSGTGIREADFLQDVKLIDCKF